MRIIIITYYILLSFYSTVIAQAEGKECDNNQLVTLSLNKQTLSDVASIVLTQTGYHVEHESIDSSLLVSGVFTNVTIEKLYLRLLKGSNIAIEFDTKEKKVKVKLLGKWLPKKEIESKNEIKQLHAQQAKQIRRQNNSPDTIEPFTGQSYGEIKKLHAQQAKQVRSQNNNPNTIEPFTGQSYGEIKKLHARQAK